MSGLCEVVEEGLPWYEVERALEAYMVDVLDDQIAVDLAERAGQACGRFILSDEIICIEVCGSKSEALDDLEVLLMYGG